MKFVRRHLVEGTLALVGLAPLLLGGCGALFPRAQPPKSSTSFPTDTLKSVQVSAYVASVVQRVSPATSRNVYFVDIFATSWVQGLSYSSGKIALTRGMLNVVAGEAELACLIGHEIAHQELDHLEERRQNAVSTAQLTNALPNVSATVPLAGRLALGDLVEDVATSGWTVAHEQEADRSGALYCAQAGYDPYAFADLFERLAKLADGNSQLGLPSLKRTHRDLGMRSTSLRSFLQQGGRAPFGGKRGYRTYVRSLASLAGNGVTVPSTNPAARVDGKARFMAERINQPRPIWDGSEIEQLDRAAQDATNRFLREQCEAGGQSSVDAHTWDAFGHCYYACEATQRFGWDWAYIAGSAREYFRELEADLGIQDHDSYQQDLDNQAYGRGADPHPIPGGVVSGDGGVPELGNQSCYDHCLQGFASGRLNLSAPQGRNCYSCSARRARPSFCH